MAEVNPYQTPQSDVSAPDDLFGEITIFSLQGRIGRLRYFVYSMLLTVILQLIVMAGMAIVMGMGGSNFTAITLITAIVVVVGTLVSAFFAAQRLHDFNASAWWYLISVLPSLYIAISPILSQDASAVGILPSNWPLMIVIWGLVVVFYLLLLFMPGMKASNRFGLEPPPNSTAVKVGAWLFAGLFALGILVGVMAAIFAPSTL